MKLSIILWKDMLGYALKGGGVVKSVFGEDCKKINKKNRKSVSSEFFHFARDAAGYSVWSISNEVRRGYKHRMLKYRILKHRNLKLRSF